MATLRHTPTDPVSVPARPSSSTNPIMRTSNARPQSSTLRARGHMDEGIVIGAPTSSRNITSVPSSSRAHPPRKAVPHTAPSARRSLRALKRVAEPHRPIGHRVPSTCHLPQTQSTSSAGRTTTCIRICIAPPHCAGHDTHISTKHHIYILRSCRARARAYSRHSHPLVPTPGMMADSAQNSCSPLPPLPRRATKVKDSAD
ncbi:hypothetical protein B0H13DRAFT_2395123 [Mycena leptocephala]|nr:hypothetical protein B0H13DRAFT_2395123 [Mycena leptocephala]